MPSAVVQLATAEHGARRTTELFHLFVEIDSTERRPDYYNALLAQQ